MPASTPFPVDCASSWVMPLCQATCDALRRRKVKMGEQLFQEATRGQRPQVDASSGLLHWPVVLCYPEPMAVDLIQDFCETDTFGSHLRTISCPQFPPSSLPARCAALAMNTHRQLMAAAFRPSEAAAVAGFCRPTVARRLFPTCQQRTALQPSLPFALPSKGP